MAPGGVVTVTTMLLCCTLGLLSLASAAQARGRPDCCMSFNRQRMSPHLFKDFTEQKDREYCRHQAIIFYTVRNKRICATIKDKWVRDAVAQLRKKKEASKSSPAKGGATMKRSGISPGGARGRSVFGGAETVPDLSSRNQNLSTSTQTATPTETATIYDATETLY